MGGRERGKVEHIVKNGEKNGIVREGRMGE